MTDETQIEFDSLVAQWPGAQIGGGAEEHCR